MQHLVPSVHARTRLVLAQQRNRIGHGANGAPIPDVELALEEKLGGVPHARGNLGRAHWFRPVSGAASSAIPPPERIRAIAYGSDDRLRVMAQHPCLSFRPSEPG